MAPKPGPLCNEEGPGHRSTCCLRGSLGEGGGCCGLCGPQVRKPRIKGRGPGLGAPSPHTHTWPHICTYILMQSHADTHTGVWLVCVQYPAERSLCPLLARCAHLGCFLPAQLSVSVLASFRKACWVVSMVNLLPTPPPFLLNWCEDMVQGNTD